MGGMGGMGNMFGGMNEDDDMNAFGGSNSPFGAFGNMPGGAPRMSRQNSQTNGRRSSFPPSGAAASSQPSEITRPLKVTLEELYNGTTKRLKVNRKLLSGDSEDKILEITVLPGWKSGTKVRFPRSGNETPSGNAQDLVFVVEEKPHSRFVREGSDLIATLKVPLVDALTSDGGIMRVESLSGSGSNINITIPSGVIRPGQETRIRGEGMPIRKDGAQRSKGDLVVKWEVVFPERLTPSQKEGIRKVLR
jgi:DnaJ family protein B protein 4